MTPISTCTCPVCGSALHAGGERREVFARRAREKSLARRVARTTRDLVRRQRLGWRP